MATLRYCAGTPLMFMWNPGSECVGRVRRSKRSLEAQAAPYEKNKYLSLCSAHTQFRSALPAKTLDAIFGGNPQQLGSALISRCLGLAPPRTAITPRITQTHGQTAEEHAIER